MVVIGVRSSWLMTSMNASRNSPGPALVGEQLVALLLEPSTLRDVLPGPDHPDGLAGLVAEHAARTVGPVDRPVRRTGCGSRG